jgi:hypothetical protein
MIYQVQVSMTQDSDREWRGTKQLPTFYLDSNVQGILSIEQARVVAGDIVNRAGWFVSSISIRPLEGRTA